MSSDKEDLNNRLNKLFKLSRTSSEDGLTDRQNPGKHQALWNMQISAQSYVEELLQHVGQQDTRFNGDILYSGSGIEQVKAIDMDEFDVMWCIAIPGDLEEAASHPGFAQYKIDTEARAKWRDLVDEDGYLSSAKSREAFEKYVQNAVVSLKEKTVTWSKKTVNLKVDIDLSGGAAVKLMLFPAEGHGFLMTPSIDVDLVLAVTWPSWPQCCSSAWLSPASKVSCWPGTSIVNEIKSRGCHIIVKPPAVASAKVEHRYWRVSTSLAESILFRHMSINRGTSLILMKVLREEFLNKGLGPQTTPVLASFALKTILLHECLEYPDESAWDVKTSLAERILSMMSKLHEALQNDVLSHFFIPRVNIFQGRGTKGPLIRKIDDFLKDPKAVLEKYIWYDLS